MRTSYQFILAVLLLLELTSAQELKVASLDSIKIDSTNSSPNDTIDYQARYIHFDQEKGLFQLRELASIKWQDATLKADTVSYSVDQKVLEASGKPRLREKSSPAIAGERMKYNLDSKVGQIYYGSSYRDRQQFNGMDIRRTPDGRLLVARGDFSTCDTLEDQHFYFYSRRMVVNPGQSLMAKPVVLNIADVPVMILPIMANPLNKERRSGLLLPKYGGDQKQGFYLQNLGYYWATNDYMDVHFLMDLMEGSKGTFDESTLKSKWRYNKRYAYSGNLDGTWYLNDFTLDSKGWDLYYSHQQNLTPDQKTTLNGSGSFVSKPKLRQENGLDKQTILNQQANADMTFRHQFRDNSVFSVNSKQDKNLTTYRTVRTFPAVQYSKSGNPFLSLEDAKDPAHEETWYEKFNYNYSNRFSRYQRLQSDSLGKHEEDTTWYSYKQSLGAQYPFQLFKIFQSSVNLNESSFWTPERFTQSQDSSSRVFDFEPSRANFGNWYHQFSTSVNTETKIYGIFRPEWGRFTGVRHVITPRLNYTIAPEIDSTPNLVYNPDEMTRSGQIKQSTMGFGLGNDFDLKYISQYKNSTDSGLVPVYTNLKVITLNTSSSYNFAADSFQFAPIQSNLGLQITPSERISFNLTHSVYDPFTKDPILHKEIQSPILTAWSFSLSRGLIWGGEFFTGEEDSAKMYKKWSANLNYSFSMNAKRIAPEVFQNSYNHTASAQFNLFPTSNWEMNYGTSYDFLNGRFAEHRFTFNRTLHCWKLTFGWTPVGPAQGWNFKVWVTDIPDIELHTSSSNLKR